MLDADDLAGLYDPAEFGTRATLKKAAQAVPVDGLILDEKPGNRLSTSKHTGAGLRVRTSGLVFQVPANAVPADWQDWLVELPAGSAVQYSIVDAAPPQSGSCNLTLNPYQPRTETHGQWLRAEN
uniref:Uncharacterized protein n=1 Tax=viral metagenome TaxID=1070528 RepID=A0A6M3J539_9ZZZZ